MQFGTFTGNSVQPRIASIRRVTIVDAVEGAAGGRPTAITPDIATRGGFALVQGEPTDTIVVTWHYETKNPAQVDGADQPYSTADAADNAVLTTALGPRFTSFSAPTTGVATVVSAIRGTRTRTNPEGTPGRGTASADATVRHDRITTYIIPEAEDHDYRQIMAKIGHPVNDADATERAAAAAVSAAVELAGVPSGVRSLVANRRVTVNEGDRDTHMLTTAWFGAGSPRLEVRIALEVLVEDSGPTGHKWEWVIFPTDNGVTPAQPGFSRATDPDTDSGPTSWGRWSTDAFDLNLTDNAGAADVWRDDDDNELLYTVTIENLRNARSLRVDTRVDDSGTWVRSAPVAIPGG